MEARRRSIRFAAAAAMCTLCVGLSGSWLAVARDGRVAATDRVTVDHPSPVSLASLHGSASTASLAGSAAGPIQATAPARILAALEPNTATAGASFLWLTVGSATREQVFDAMDAPAAGSEQEPVWTDTPVLRNHGVRRVMARFDADGVLEQLLIDLAEPVPLADLAVVLALGERTETRTPTDGPGELHVHRTSAAALRVEAGSARSIWLLPDHRPAAGPDLPDDDLAVSLPLPSPEERLIEAARTGDVERVRRLLALGTPAFTPDSFGRTAAHHAAMFGHDEVLRALMQTLEDAAPGASPAADAAGDPVFGHGWDDAESLPAAFDDGTWPGAFDDLLFRLQTVNASDEQELTALHLAAREGHARAAEVLLDAGADPTMAAGDGSTPLHHAARAGATELVAVLVARGAHVDDRDALDRTPREVAADEAVARHLEALEHALRQDPDFLEAERALDAFFDAIRAGDAAGLQAMLLDPTEDAQDEPLEPVAIAYLIKRMQVRYGTALVEGALHLPDAAREDRDHAFTLGMLQEPEGWRVLFFRVLPAGE